MLKRNDELKQRYRVAVENEYEMMRDECDENDPGHQWERLSEPINEGFQISEEEEEKKNYH